VTVTAFLGSVLTGVLIFGQLLLVLGLMVSVMCAFIVAIVISDICNMLRIKRQRRAEQGDTWGS